MTPRNLLRFAKDDVAARRLAVSSGFDVVPLSRQDGRVLEFWSQVEGRRRRTGRIHRVSHDRPIDALLPRLGAHVIQFVCFRSEVVGLIDASDLNRPTARIAWLQPMLELERAVLDTVRRLEISDADQAAALGSRAVAARGRQRKAMRESLELPLVEYAQFPELLGAAAQLGLLDIDEKAVRQLNEVRKRAAHSGDLIVESRRDCHGLQEAIRLARVLAHAVSSRRAWRR
jgi:hypothetical protein